jgi:hypothetical protein
MAIQTVLGVEASFLGYTPLTKVRLVFSLSRNVFDTCMIS